jgi:hypothetical protein
MSLYRHIFEGSHPNLQTTYTRLHETQRRGTCNAPCNTLHAARAFVKDASKGLVEERLKGRKDPVSRLRETKGFAARNSSEKRPNLFSFPLSRLRPEPHPPKKGKRGNREPNRFFLILASRTPNPRLQCGSPTHARAHEPRKRFRSTVWDPLTSGRVGPANQIAVSAVATLRF